MICLFDTFRIKEIIVFYKMKDLNKNFILKEDKNKIARTDFKFCFIFLLSFRL